jgi:hypothetical protein
MIFSSVYSYQKFEEEFYESHTFASWLGSKGLASASPLPLIGCKMGGKIEKCKGVDSFQFPVASLGFGELTVES